MAGRRRNADLLEQAAAQANQAAEQAPAQPEAAPEPVEQPQADAPQREIRRGNRIREAAMEEIVAARQPKQEPEAPQAQIKPEPGQAPVVEPAVPAPEPTVEPSEPIAAAEPIKTVKQKVDGKEYDVPQTEIEEAGGEKAWRINKAAANRLEESKAALAEAKRHEAQLAQAFQAIAQRANPQQPQVSDQEFIMQQAAALQSGDQQQIAQGLQQLFQRFRPDPQQITSYTMTEVRKQSAVDAFKTEFPDVVNNPLLLRLAVALDQERMRANPSAYGPQFDFAGHFRKIGEEVRSLVPRPSQPQPAPQTAASNSSPTPSDREARKASIVTLPVAAARATPPAEEKPESREDIINSIAKARGKLPIY